jgi:hypothetical protein
MPRILFGICGVNREHFHSSLGYLIGRYDSDIIFTVFALYVTCVTSRCCAASLSEILDGRNIN